MRFYDPECIRAFIDYLLQKGKKIEIVFSMLMPQEEKYLLIKGFTKKDSYWTIYLDTLRKDSIFSAIASDKIRNYKKASKYGLNYCINLSNAQREIFIENLKKYSNYDDGDSVLEHKINVLMEMPGVQIATIYFEDAQIAGALLLHTENICEVRYNYTNYNFRNLTPLTYLLITLFNNTKGKFIDLSGLTTSNDFKKLNINLYKFSFDGLIYEFKRYKFIKKQ